jgi:voltage-gated potassium channel
MVARARRSTRRRACALIAGPVPPTITLHAAKARIGGINAMKRHHRFTRFVRDVLTWTPLLKMIVLLAALWLGFAAALYAVERGAAGAAIESYGQALYWGIAAFSTAGIADTPATGAGRLIGGVWIVIGSLLFFGTLVATVTAYFMRPLQRPARQIVETIEYNLERLDDLSLGELDLLKDTVDALIEHMESLKAAQARQAP